VVDLDGAKIQKTSRIVVEMIPFRNPSSLVLSSGLAWSLEPSVGIVLASTADGCKPGEMVLFRPDDGIRVTGAEMGSYEPQNDILVYGAYATTPGFPLGQEKNAWYKSVLAELTMVDNIYQVKAKGNNFVAKKDQASGKSEGGILLPDGHHERSEMATVTSVGPLCDPELKPGMRVSYNPHYVEQNGVEVGGYLDFDYFIADELAINWVIEPVSV
jgi:co-chaperonin GroES (HSP10)